MTLRAAGKLDLIWKVRRIELLVAALVSHILFVKRRSIQNHNLLCDAETISRDGNDTLNKNLIVLGR